MKPKFISFEKFAIFVTWLKEALLGKVDKEQGKSLVDDAQITKLEALEADAQENVIESISVNGVTQVVDNNKNAQIYLPINRGATSNSAVIGRISGNTASKQYAIAEGSETTASGEAAHSEGERTVASGNRSHAEGVNTEASGGSSHAEGQSTKATEFNAHAEGANTTASGQASHAQNSATTASGNFSSAEGRQSVASGLSSHAQNHSTTASGDYSHSEGWSSVASGQASHAQGHSTVANRLSQFVFGEYNVEDTGGDAVYQKGNYIEIVGNGLSNAMRSNARTLDWSGNETLAGKLTVGTNPTTSMDVATKGYVDEGLANIDLTEYATNAYVDGELIDLRADLTTKVFNITYNETFSEIPSINPVRMPYAFDFVEGKTYHFKIECINVNPLTQTNQFLIDASTSANPSISNIPEVIYRSGSSVNVYTGAIIEFDYTPTRSDLHGFLLRYKTNTGVQNFTVDITTTGNFQSIEDEYQNMLEKIKNVQTLIPNQSRMEFGAHRGAESFAPPNSIAAYEIAGKMGFQWAWLAQIRWSSSKTLYVMHDEDVSITTNGTGNLSELTDEYINSLLCNKIQNYDYSKFTDDELRVPTLEKVIQICVKYGMKMCFRIEPFPADMDTEDNALIWNNFANLIKEYNIKDGIYSGYNANELKLCRTLIGDNENLCPFRGNTTTGQDYVDFFTNSNITGKRSVLLYYQNATQSDIKLLHKNGIEVYVFYNGTRPSQNEINQWATYGVEILQNPNTSKLTI